MDIFQTQQLEKTLKRQEDEHAQMNEKWTTKKLSLEKYIAKQQEKHRGEIEQLEKKVERIYFDMYISVHNNVVTLFFVWWFIFCDLICPPFFLLFHHGVISVDIFPSNLKVLICLYM